MDCYRTGKIIAVPQLDESSPWPEFARESLAAEADIDLARAFADVASIAIIQNQAAQDAAMREHQLQNALDSRVVIEQAKGMLAEHTGLDMDGSFTRLRLYARRHNRGLTATARALIAGMLSVGAVASTEASR